MPVTVASRRTSLKMTSEGKNLSSGEETSSGNAGADLRTFGRYVIEKKLGEGGMGAVYRAIDSNLKRTVALKILPREKAKNDILVKRFQAEAEAAAQLRHRLKHGPEHRGRDAVDVGAAAWCRKPALLLTHGTAWYRRGR